jgi:two-component system, OmpR family, phosphate regulon response regulator PhoB
MTAKAVLVVEDNMDMAEIYRLTLEDYGYTVLMAHSGRDALQILNSYRPQVIVMDLTIPDGVAGLLGALDTVAEHREAKLIIVSGRNDLEEIARKHRARGYLRKPFDMSALIALL